MTTIKDKYRVVHDPKDPSKWCVELLAPCAPFHGIIYSYGQFTINEPNETRKNATFTYESDIIYVPDRLRNEVFPDSAEKEMQNLLGEILLDIISDNLANTKQDSGKLFLELQANDKR